MLQATAGKQHCASGQVEIPIHSVAETIIAAKHLLFVPQVELYINILDKLSQQNALQCADVTSAKMFFYGIQAL